MIRALRVYRLAGEWLSFLWTCIYRYSLVMQVNDLPQIEGLTSPCDMKGCQGREQKKKNGRGLLCFDSDYAWHTCPGGVSGVHAICMPIMVEPLMGGLGGRMSSWTPARRRQADAILDPCRSYCTETRGVCTQSASHCSHFPAYLLSVHASLCDYHR